MNHRRSIALAALILTAAAPTPATAAPPVEIHVEIAGGGAVDVRHITWTSEGDQVTTGRCENPRSTPTGTLGPDDCTTLFGAFTDTREEWLTAAPPDGWVFERWSGAPCDAEPTRLQCLVFAQGPGLQFHPQARVRAHFRDVRAPDTTITGGPVSPHVDSAGRAVFDFTVAPAGEVLEEPRFQCQLNGDAWHACSPPHTYDQLAVGRHQFCVRAIDPSGNEDPSPACRAWEQRRPAAAAIDLDRDADGFPRSADCNDDRPDIHPGARDIPGNAIDEDCDSTPWDRDGDGYASPADCDDGLTPVHPSAPDAPRNRIDEDCDGADADVPHMSSVIGHLAVNRGRVTRIRKLTVSRPPAGARVELTCRGRTCPKRRWVKSVRPGAPRVSFTKAFRRARLTPNTVIRLEVTKPDMYGKLLRLTTRRGHAPAVTRRCVDPVTHRRSRC